jgi:hypothetical protein
VYVVVDHMKRSESCQTALRLSYTHNLSGVLGTEYDRGRET